jgi:hypothetical protein
MDHYMAKPDHAPGYKFYIHFGGSLEYWINEYEYEYTPNLAYRDSEHSPLTL